MDSFKPFLLHTSKKDQLMSIAERLNMRVIVCYFIEFSTEKQKPHRSDGQMMETVFQPQKIRTYYCDLITNFHLDLADSVSVHVSIYNGRHR